MCSYCHREIITKTNAKLSITMIDSKSIVFNYKKNHPIILNDFLGPKVILDIVKILISVIIKSNSHCRRVLWLEPLWKYFQWAKKYKWQIKYSTGSLLWELIPVSPLIAGYPGGLHRHYRYTVLHLKYTLEYSRIKRGLVKLYRLFG